MPHVVAPSEAGSKLVDVVREHLGVVAVREVGELVRAGAVAVDGRPGTINEPVPAGATLTVDAAALAALDAAGRTTPPSAAALTVVHEDDHLLVVDKPAGMHVHPMGPHRADTLVGALLWRAGARPAEPWCAWRPRPTHRLDRVTSGLLLVARTAAVQRAVDLLRAAGAVHRRYEATVHGAVPGEAGTVDAPLGRDPGDDRRRTTVPVADGGQPALTRWEVVGRGTVTTTLSVTLGTGRTHQVRAHLAGLGHPIVGDGLYGAPDADTDAGSVAIALRAVTLELPHPVTGVRLALRAP